MALPDLVEAVAAWAPEAVLFGHSGSTSGHPVIAAVSRAVASRLPGIPIVYGGVYPTYHWREILAEEPHVAAIVRGEGEETVRASSSRRSWPARLSTRCPAWRSGRGRTVRDAPRPTSGTSTPTGSAGS